MAAEGALLALPACVRSWSLTDCLLMSDFDRSRTFEGEWRNSIDAPRNRMSLCSFDHSKQPEQMPPEPRFPVA
jgi:hypothetical protein